MGHYFAKGSRMNVLSHLRQLSIFCIAFNETFLPVQNDTLLGFIELMSRTCGYEHIQHIKSSIAPKSFSSFNPDTGLSRQKALLFNGVVLVYQNFSKTNQCMSSTRVTPLVPGAITALNPVYHYEKLIRENPVQRTCSAFSFLDNGIVKCVTYQSFTDFLKVLLVKIGLNPKDWTGHSFRRGGASLLYRLGIDPLTIQSCGDWSTDTFLRYIEVNIDRLWSAQTAMGSFSCSLSSWLGCLLRFF